MKSKRYFIFSVLAINLLFSVGCTGGKSNVTEISEIVISGESMIDEKVIVEGLCTHVCEKSGMKLFLKDEKSDFTIRAESSATLGKFDPDCVDKYVRVVGTIAADEQIVNSTNTHHTEECESENSQIIFHIEAEHYQIIE